LDPAAVGSTEQHNLRQYTKEEMPKNIKPSLQENMNQYFGSGVLEPKKLADVINDRLNNHGIKLKKNQNCAIEFVVGASSDFWKSYSPSGHFSNAHKWLEERYGKGSVVSKSEHYDELNPHCHFIVVPVLQKEIKWKNRNGSGSRVESRLSIREITGGRDKLRKLQDDYFEFISPFGAKYGLEFKRGNLKAQNTLDQYVQHTSHELGEIRLKLASLSDEKEKLALLLGLTAKVAEIEDNAVELAKKAELEKFIRKINFKRGIGSEMDAPRKKPGRRI
jgi:hypothetical protein